MERWQNRVTEYPCDEIFLTRTSTRAFDTQKNVTKEELMSCFEAARWAPSCFNSQPWRYVYAEKGSAAYQHMLESLVEFNQSWAKNAQFLILLCSRTKMSFNQSHSRTHSLDAGASYMQFILQAHLRNIACHPMDGFSHEKIRTFFNIPEIYQIQTVIACGLKGSIESLSKELKDKELPTTRKSLNEIISENNFLFD